jgi:hypothetical protein
VKILRILAICWLILALPVQGFAAASLVLCHPAQSQTSHETAHASQVHQHDPAVSHQHLDHRADIKVSKLNHKCSNCTQCCAGFVLAFFEQPRFMAIQTKSALVEFLPTLHSSIALRGLERPPRTPSA